MVLKFKKAEINNFLSIGHAEVGLDDRGYVLVNGVNNCASDNAKSNGAGKSAIYDAILWCLTGETSRGVKEVSNIFGDDGALVTLDIDVDGQSYKITRTKNHSIYKTNLKIYCNGEDISGKGIRDGEKIFAERLGELTVELLGGVVLLGQGMPYRFTNNSPSKRKEVLEQLSKSDFMIKDVKDRVAKRKTQIENDIANNNITLSNIDAQRKIYKAQIDDCTNKIEEIKGAMQFDNTNELIAQKEEMEKQKLSAEGNMSLSQKCKDTQNALLIEAMDKAASFEDREDIIKTREQLAQYKQDGATISATATQIKRQFEELDNVVDVCPTCGQKLPGIVKIDTSELHRQYDELVKQFNDILVKGLELNSWVSNEETQFNTQCKKEQDEIHKAINNADVAIKNYKQSIDKLNKDIADISNVISQYELNKRLGEERLKELWRQINNAEEEISKLDGQEVVCNNVGDILSRRRTVLVNMESLVKRDFRGYLLSDVIKYIEGSSKKYCYDIFGTQDISIVLNGNDIDILYNQKEYESLSGGEKQKIDTIVQLAIRDMLKVFMGFSSNIIVFDEVFDFLDKKGADALIQTISTQLQDVSSVFIVTHHTDIVIPYDDIITVTKGYNGISEIS